MSGSATSPIERAENVVNEVATGCVECGKCVAQCEFLKFYGNPKKITAEYRLGTSGAAMSFECSLCGLCRAVCPFGVDPQALFLELRRDAVRRGEGPPPEARGLLGYERKGTSRLLTWYGLPEGCDAVFFPGCALPGTRPETTFWAYERLREAIPSLGVVLDCCTKPSHDLGREEYFEETFGELRDYLKARGIRRVIVACPNCWKVFARYAPEVNVETVYEVLSPSARAQGEPAATVHDPCVMREAEDIFGAVRDLARGCGVSLTEMDHSREKTLCCGEGGAVGYVAPDLAGKWGEKRVGEAGERPIIAYCAGCANFLTRRGGKVAHLLDLLRDPEGALGGRAEVARAPFTYLNRLRLKARFKRELPAAVTRERSPKSAKSASLLKPLLLLAAIVLLILAARGTGIGEYLEEGRLKTLISGYGALAPALYILLYTISPVFLLPALPITIVGGVVFGPFWGVLYTITGATMGACAAFFVSRYVARGFIERRLVGSRWRVLDDKIALHGWKVVAFTRLVPIFPYWLMNYALGMTRIAFLPYLVATFLGMLPATVAFIVFSASLVDLLRGKVSPQLLLGVVLLAAVSSLPLVVRRLRSGPKEKPRLRPRPYRFAASLRKKLALAGAGVTLFALWNLFNARIHAIFSGYLDVAEFNLNFIKNRFADGNEALLTDYFSALGPLKFPLMAGVAAFRSTFVDPLAKLDANGAILASKGAWAAIGGLGAGFWLLSLLTLGAGWFLLSDLLPVRARKRGEEAKPLGPVWEGIALALAALPGPPLWLAPLILALGRAKPHRAALALLLGALVRAAVTYLSLR